MFTYILLSGLASVGNLFSSIQKSVPRTFIPSYCGTCMLQLFKSPSHFTNSVSALNKKASESSFTKVIFLFAFRLYQMLLSVRALLAESATFPVW